MRPGDFAWSGQYRPRPGGAAPGATRLSTVSAPPESNGAPASGWFAAAPVRWLNTSLLTLGVTAIAAAGALYVATWLPGSPMLAANEGLPFFLLIFPLWGWMFLIARQRGRLGTRRTRWKPGDARATREGTRSGGLALEPAGATRYFAIAFVLNFVNFAAAMFVLRRGDPEYRARTHRYVLDDHGAITVVSHALYLRSLAWENRMELAFAMLFIGAASGWIYVEWRRRRAPAPATGGG
jgi:hypothetical protein